jgi:hypothetical protein
MKMKEQRTKYEIFWLPLQPNKKKFTRFMKKAHYINAAIELSAVVSHGF